MKVKIFEEGNLKSDFETCSFPNLEDTVNTWLTEVWEQGATINHVSMTQNQDNYLTICIFYTVPL